MTQVPAVVTILGLPAGTTITGAELIEAVQTTGGVANSVSLSLSQAIGALGGLPASGGTGQVLQSLGTGFAASWVTISSLVTASSGLSAAGSTAVALSLAAGSGLSVLGVAGTTAAKPLPVVGIAAQVLRINDAGTALAFGAVNLGSAAAITGVLPGANYSAVNLAATGAGGIQGQPFFLPTTALPAAGASTVGIRISSAAALGIYLGTGAPTFTASIGALYLNGGAVTATSRLYINTGGTTTWATFTASA